jgi:hypothetical protein
MICASKLPNGLDLGGFVLRPAMIGHEPNQTATAPYRERIAGYEITRSVPDAVWNEWYGRNASGPIVGNGLVFGSNDYDEVAAFCWRNRDVRGWQKAPQG